jgi:hypothetical protein
MELTRSVVWNQDAGKDEYSLMADAMPDEVGIPYTLTRDAIPSLRLG